MPVKRDGKWLLSAILAGTAVDPDCSTRRRLSNRRRKPGQKAAEQQSPRKFPNLEAINKPESDIVHETRLLGDPVAAGQVLDN